MKEIVAVAMPVFNDILHIKNAIDSVIRQSDPCWNLFISDNASTDGTTRLLKEIEGMLDNRVTIYYQRRNLGIYGNLNFLTSVICTDIIHILCSDDEFADVNALKRIRNKFPHSKSVGAVRWNSPLHGRLTIPGHLRPLASQLFFAMHGNLLGNLSNVTYRKSALMQSGMFNTAYPFVGDFATWARLALKYDIVIEPEIVTTIRRHENSASVYLNTKGELFTELSDLVGILLADIKSSNALARLALRLALSVVYDSSYRLSAMVRALNGNPVILKSLDQASRNSVLFLGVPALWILSVITLGGRLFKPQLVALVMSIHKGPFQLK